MTRDQQNRYLTAIRLLSHWMLGATVGSLVTADRWNGYAMGFLVLYLYCQATYAILRWLGKESV